MIVGRSPRMPVIGDIVLSRAGHARGTGIIVAQTRSGTRSTGATAETHSVGMCAVN